MTRPLSGKLSLDNVSERKDEMRLGMTLTSNPKDGSFVVSPRNLRDKTLRQVMMEDILLPLKSITQHLKCTPDIHEDNKNKGLNESWHGEKDLK